MSIFKAYIAGPMSGIPKFNFPAFEEAAKYVRETHGWHVVSPHELDDPATREWAEASDDGDAGGRWGEFLGRDLELIRNGGVNIIVLLPGWHNSQGARLEASLGLDCGCQFWRLTRRPVKQSRDVLTLVSVRARDVAAMVRPELTLPESKPAIPYAPPLPNIIADAAVPRDKVIAAPSVEAAEALIEQFKAADPVSLSATPSPTLAVFDEIEPDAETKPTNPKDLVGSSKLPLHLWPTTASVWGSLALLDGALKYGRSNWRAAGVRYSIYMDAAIRHLYAAFEGEDADPDSGLPHEAHALACLAIIVDARAAGKLHDDRAFNGGHYRDLIDEATPFVEKIKVAHADRDPKHYTIADHAEGGVPE